MTKSKPELLQKLAKFYDGEIKEEWKSWPTYKILIELNSLRKDHDHSDDDAPDVSTSTRLWTRSV